MGEHEHAGDELERAHTGQEAEKDHRLVEQVVHVIDAVPAGVGGRVDPEDMVGDDKVVEAGLLDAGNELAHKVRVPGNAALGKDDA